MTDQEAVEACTGPLAQTGPLSSFGVLSASQFPSLIPDEIEADVCEGIFDASGISLWDEPFGSLRLVDLYLTTLEVLVP